MARAHIGVGANSGERLVTLAAALRDVDALEETTVVAVSRVYASSAWPDPQSPPYANAVAVIDTELAPDVLLDALKEIECSYGRDPAGATNAPRPVDLDILLMGDEEWVSERLTIPHPRMSEREFVITPLLEVDPLATMPDGSPVQVGSVRFGPVTEVLGVLPGFEALTRGIDAPEGGPFGGWVVVAEAGGAGQGEAFPVVGAALMFERAVLEDEGIPYAWDPYPPEQWTNPYGLLPLFRLLVPASFAQRARGALAAAAAAPPDFTDGVVD